MWLGANAEKPPDFKSERSVTPGVVKDDINVMGQFLFFPDEQQTIHLCLAQTGASFSSSRCRLGGNGLPAK